MSIYTRPSVMGVMRESPGFQEFGVGLTDRLFLLGHSDGFELNDPYQVVSMQEAINKFNADFDSPLLRALFEAYHSGARDIWLVAVAPMSEYEPDISARISNGLYTTYYDRLTTTYNLLLE